MQDVAMFCDLGSIHMIVTGGKTISTQSTASDHVKTSSRAVRSSNGNSSSGTRRWRKMGLGDMLYTHRATAKETRRKELTSLIKEALDTGDEDEKKVEAFTAEFEQPTEWLEVVLGDKLKSTSKELMDIGADSRVRTIGQVDEGCLSAGWTSGEVGSV